MIAALLIGLHPNSWYGPLAMSLHWRWLGLALALGLHGQVCTRVRIIALAGMLVLAALPYIWLEMRLAKHGKTLAPLWPSRRKVARGGKEAARLEGRSSRDEKCSDWEQPVPSSSVKKKRPNIFICRTRTSASDNERFSAFRRSSLRWWFFLLASFCRRNFHISWNVSAGWDEKIAVFYICLYVYIKISVIIVSVQMRLGSSYVVYLVSNMLKSFGFLNLASSIF